MYLVILIRPLVVHLTPDDPVGPGTSARLVKPSSPSRDICRVHLLVGVGGINPPWNRDLVWPYGQSGLLYPDVCRVYLCYQYVVSGWMS